MKPRRIVCRRAMAAMERHRDGGREPGPRLRAHAEHCPRCAEHVGYLASLEEDLRGAMCRTLDALPEPDLEAIRAEARRRRGGDGTG